LSALDLLSKRVVLSHCEKYRYWLTRELRKGDIKPVIFVMLNPSTADGENDDRTITRCMDYAKRWGGSHLVVVNLFAIRSTDPKLIKKVDDPYGVSGDDAIRKARDLALLHDGVVVCAWGEHGQYKDRDKAVLEALYPCAPKALKINASGSPAHPLYQKKDAVLIDMNIDHMVKYGSVIEQVCAKDDDMREYLKTPFDHKGYVCATNGRVAVFFEGECGNKQLEENVVQLLDTKLVNRPDALQPMSDFDISVTQTVDVKCAECEGTGYVEFTTDKHEYTCECKECEGVGVKSDQGYTRIVGFEKYAFNTDALQIIQGLPNVEFGHSKDKDIHDLYFTFVGGFGVMGGKLAS